MLLPGHVAFSRRIISKLICPKTQIQPCGVDLSVKSIFTFTGAGVIDFNNSQRQVSSSSILPWSDRPLSNLDSQSPNIQEGRTTTKIEEKQELHTEMMKLKKGRYLVEFNEMVDFTDSKIMGEIYTRSTAWRSGCVLHAGVVDAGYKGVLGALLHVENEEGVILGRNARLAQIVFHEMLDDGKGEGNTMRGYSGVYQGRSTMLT